MKRDSLPAQPVPFGLEASTPVRDVLNFVDQEAGGCALRSRLCLCPEPFPESGERGLGLVPGSVERRWPESAREVEQQGRLADLPRPDEKLDAARRRLSQAPEQRRPAGLVIERVLFIDHDRIIIRL